MSAIAAVILGAAAKVGAGVVKGILEKHVGGLAGTLAGSVVDSVAEKLGVPPEKIPEVPPKDIAVAVERVEAETPEIIEAWLNQQQATHNMLKADTDKDRPWTWAWRPGGMYLLGAYWTWIVIVVPLVNLFLSLAGASAELRLIIDVATLMTLTVTFVGLYMGGHTAKDMMTKWRDSRSGS